MGHEDRHISAPHSINRSVFEWFDYWESELFLELISSWRILWLNCKTEYNNWTPVDMLGSRRRERTKRLTNICNQWCDRFVVKLVATAQNELVTLLTVSAQSSFSTSNIVTYVSEGDLSESIKSDLLLLLKFDQRSPTQDDISEAVVGIPSKYDDDDEKTVYKNCVKRLQILKVSALEQ